MTTPLYFDNFCLRFNSNLQALEYNSGNEVWVEVPVPTGDLGLLNGKILVGNASNIATAVTLSGAATISNTGALTLTLAQYSTIAGNASGHGVANTTLTVDTVGNKVGINIAPDAVYTLRCAGPAYFSGTGSDVRVGRDLFVANDNAGAVHVYHIESTDATAPLSLNDQVVQSVRMPNMTTTQKNGLVTQAAGCVVFDTTLAALNIYNGSTWSGLGTSVGTAAGTGTVTPSIVGVSTVSITVSGALTINGPTGAADGQKIVFRIINDGSHSVTFAAGAGNFAFGTTIPSYTNSVSLIDYVGVIWNTTAGVWHIVSVSQGF